MAMPSIIASNLTGGAILLTRLGLTVPASTTLTLSDFASINEIREDDSLESAIRADELVLNYGDGDLTKGDSLKFFNIITQEARIPVRALSTSNIGSLSGTTTIDTVALAVNDRVLLTGQTTASENGIWVIKAGAWERPEDFQTDQSAGALLVVVREGAAAANEVWVCENNEGADVVGTSLLTFTQVSGSGGGGGHTMQAAYDGGNTIVTAGSVDIAFTLTAGDFTVDNGTVALGASTPLTAFTVDTGLMSLDSTDTTNLTMSAADGANKTLTIAASNSGAGTGLIAMTADGTIDIDSVGALSLNSSGDVINIGDDAVSQAINIGTAGVRTISMGNATGATQLDLDSGTSGTLIDSTGIVSIDAVGNSNFTTDSGNLTLATTTSGGIIASSAGIIDVDATGAVTIDSSGGTIGIGVDDIDQAINIGTDGERVITIGNNTGVTGVAIETGTGNFLVDSPTSTFTGNLVVQGTTSTIESEIVNIADSYLWLNDGYETTGSPLDGGIAVNVNPQTDNDTVAATGFVAGVNAVSNPTVETTTGAIFAVGDFIQIAGAADQQNDGLYEVLDHTGTTLTIAGVGTTGTSFNFTQNDFVTDTTVQGTIRKVEIGVLGVSSTGFPQFGYDGDSGSFTFVNLLTAATVSLQVAYDGGNTIVTAGGIPVLISGSEKLQITAAGGLDVDTLADFDVTTFDVQMTGTNGFSIDGTAASNITVDAGLLTLATTTSGAIEVDGVDGVDLNSSAGPINIGDDADTGDINVGTGAAARDITIGNNTGATGVTIDSGTEQVEIDGVTYYGAVAADPTATSSGFQDGDKYFNTVLDMEMRYDSTRAKWLSVEAMYIQFGRQGNVGASVFYRGVDRQVMSSTTGYFMPYAGTVVGLGYTRNDADAATFDIVEGGTSRATLASSAVSGKSNALDGDFSQDGILAIQNEAGSNTTTNVMGWVKVKFRA
jgi:hypothetical protein